MSLRAIILLAMAVLGIVLLGVWQFAPSMFTDARGVMEGERLEMLVARAGLWGPVVIVALMTIAVGGQPDPQRPDRAGRRGGLRASVWHPAGGDRCRTGGVDRFRTGTGFGA